MSERVLHERNSVLESEDEEQIYHRTSDLVPNCDASKDGNVLLEFIKALKPGTEMYRIALPAIVLQPFSLLEKLANVATPHSGLLHLSELATPEQRLLAVSRWYICNLVVIPQKGINSAKPCNPVLGEVFSCKWNHSNGTTTTFVAEQVRHHPPISAVHMENKACNFSYDIFFEPHSRFLGNSIATTLEGQFHFSVGAFNEVYTIESPPVVVKGVLFGSSVIEPIGKLIIACPKTSQRFVLDFKKNLNVEGHVEIKEKRVFTLQGNLTSAIKLIGNQQEQLFFDASDIPKITKITRPVAIQASHESRVIWHRVAVALFNKDFKRANEEKIKVEETQRQITKQRKDQNIEWVPKYFTFRDGRWVYNGKPIEELP